MRPWLTGQAASGRQWGWPGPVPVPSWLASSWAESWAFRVTCFLGAWLRFASYWVLLRTNFVHCGRGWQHGRLFCCCCLFGLNVGCFTGVAEPLCQREEGGLLLSGWRRDCGSSSWCFPLPSCAPQIFLAYPWSLSFIHSRHESQNKR